VKAPVSFELTGAFVSTLHSPEYRVGTAFPFFTELPCRRTYIEASSAPQRSQYHSVG
jgi:hypothetical protein